MSRNYEWRVLGGYRWNADRADDYAALISFDRIPFSHAAE